MIEIIENIVALHILIGLCISAWYVDNIVKIAQEDCTSKIDCVFVGFFLTVVSVLTWPVLYLDDKNDDD